MALKAFKQIQLEDRTVGAFQQNVSDAFDPIVKTPILGGNLLSEDDKRSSSEHYEGIKLYTGRNNYINHRLNRKIQGWVLTRVRSQSIVWDSQDLLKAPNGFPPYSQENTLILNCSADVTVDLWVF